MRLDGLAAFCAASAALIASPAMAHAHLVKSDPAAKASVDAPGKVALTFSEKLVPAFSKLDLSMAMGSQSMAMPVKTSVAADGVTLIGTPQGKLPRGSYTAHWTAASSDGHKTSGSITFQVK